MIKSLLSIMMVCITFISLAQIHVNRNFDLELSEDSLTAGRLESSLNAFLSEAEKGVYTEMYSDSSHRQQYEFFFEKLSKIGPNVNPIFNQPIVLRSFPKENATHDLTISYTGIRNEVPFVFQVTELIAKPYGEGYKFYCAFEERTEHFKSFQIDSVRYYFSHQLDSSKAKAFAYFKKDLSSQIKTSNSKLDYYSFRDLSELLKSYGFLYSARQCNFLCYDLGFMDNQGSTYLTGTNNENYRFGFIGDFLYYNLPNRDQLYWPFVQGLATYYGGYGLSGESVEELKGQFREKLKKTPDTDFLEEFKKGRKSSVNRHFSYYVMSTFICEKLIKEKGFDEVLDLAYSGENGENFFDHLESVLGINEVNFHKTIVEMIDN